LISIANRSSEWHVHFRTPLFILIVIFFGVLTILVHMDAFSSLDKFVNTLVISLKLNETMLYTLIVFASFGEIIYLILVSIILTIIGRTRKIGMILLITIVVITLTSSNLKPLVGHLKPAETIKLDFLPAGYNLESDSMTPSSRNYSYPSNHVASIIAFSFIIGYSISKRFPRYGQLIWLLSLSVIISQLLLNEAYFSDMVGGILLGLIIAIFTSNILHLDVPFSKDRFKRSELG
jgi:undecaprenyl-diphosphatase